MENERIRVEPADYFFCPICRGPVEESWCGTCKAHVIVNWGPLYVPDELHNSSDR